MVNGREAKDRLYEAFARTAKAVASPKRIELLELLAQGERMVDALAGATGMGVTNTSAHLHYCVLAPQAVERLAAKGYRARRLVDGFPEWRLAGLPVAAGEE